MILYFRFWLALLLASFKPRLPYSSLTTETFRVLPLDCASKTLNNARFFSFMDVAQHVNNVRTGFLKEAFNRSWRVVIRNSRITYFKPLKLFSKFTVTAQVVTWDEKYFYWKNEFFNTDGALVARAYTAVSVRNRKDRKGVTPYSVLQQLAPALQPVSPPIDIQRWLSDLG